MRSTFVFFSLTILLTFGSPFAAQAEVPHEPVFNWGGMGPTAERFQSPQAVAVKQVAQVQVHPAEPLAEQLS